MLSLLGAIGATACSDAAAPSLRGANVIVLTLDTVRADFLGSFGHERQTSPFLDELARESIVFELATSPSSQTVPAMASLFTGLYPHRHGLQYWAGSKSFHPSLPLVPPRFGEQLQSISGRLREMGYRTAAVVTNPWLQAQYGFARGFDEYVRLDGRGSKSPFERASAVNAEVHRILAERGDEPFFLYVHYMDAHNPYDPPPELRKRFAPGEGEYVYENGPLEGLREEDLQYTRALYEAGIRGLDDALKELFADLSELGVLDDTLVIVASDHGEGFAEHGGLGHGWALYEELLHVFLSFSHPSLTPHAGRSDAPASLVDVLPTVMDLVEGPADPTLDGISLVPWMFGDPPKAASQRILLSELGDIRAVRRGRFKLIQWLGPDGRFEAYDLARDPGESSPIEAPTDWRKALEAQLLSLPQENPPDARSPQGLDPETAELLRKLGYVD